MECRLGVVSAANVQLATGNAAKSSMSSRIGILTDLGPFLPNLPVDLPIPARRPAVLLSLLIDWAGLARG